ncbi:MAG: alpha/beta fold hydrolase [Alphaproteobacteria bacterium]
MPTVESLNATIYYEVHGEGPALAFAHGHGGNAASWWQQVPHFSRRYTVVVFDHRAFGRSRCAPEDCHPRHFAGDLLAILDEEGIGTAALVTQSMGGWTGLRLAVEHPERVACLVLTSTIGGLLTDEVRALVAAVDDSGLGFPARVLAPDFPAREPALTQLYLELARFNTARPAESRERLYDRAAAIDVAALQDYRTPTRFISCERDQVFPPHVIRAAAALVPGAEVVDFPGTGHSPYWEDAPRYNRLVEEFLEKHVS